MITYIHLFLLEKKKKKIKMRNFKRIKKRETHKDFGTRRGKERKSIYYVIVELVVTAVVV